MSTKLLQAMELGLDSTPVARGIDNRNGQFFGWKAEI